MVDTVSGEGLRAISRRAVQAEIARHALALFAERGFDATTVEQVAAAAGVSTRSFFRYFPAKEDVVIGDPLPAGRLLASARESRAAAEPAGVALRHALHALLDTVRDDPVTALQSSRLMLSTPSLRARHLEKQQVWERLLVPETLRRLRAAGGPTDEMRARALVSAALACLDVALLQWAADDGTSSPHDLLDAALGVVAEQFGGT